MREDFIGFVIVKDLSGEGLFQAILKYLQNSGLDLSLMRGQSYDGASAMKSDVVGVKTVIQAQYPLAVFTYCSNHCLNLVISSACANTHIRNMIGTVKETVSFFSRSAKRSNALKEFITKTQGEAVRIKGLISLCETR
ncbi:hypothetical protein RI129_002836 [Pyrocoelia pectoralis]|uniref:DUF4371 domain-containing protein n=1 Tax=Pyrocoelia pectoralis TaxID=417401 RepID=A0AAN7VQF5_9COLE